MNVSKKDNGCLAMNEDDEECEHMDFHSRLL
jgi:hypothetical protein